MTDIIKYLSILTSELIAVGLVGILIVLFIKEANKSWKKANKQYKHTTT